MKPTELITKIFRDKNPNGSGLVWVLRYDDGREAYTYDAASGRNMFRLKDELRYRQDNLAPSLYARYLRIETQRGYIRKPGAFVKEM